MRRTVAVFLSCLLCRNKRIGHLNLPYCFQNLSLLELFSKSFWLSELCVWFNVGYHMWTLGHTTSFIFRIGHTMLGAQGCISAKGFEGLQSCLQSSHQSCLERVTRQAPKAPFFDLLSHLTAEWFLLCDNACRWICVNAGTDDNWGTRRWYDCMV